MKVHVVSKHPTEDRILGRLARTLATENGWTHSDECRSDVDLNYVIPYLYVAERWMDWTTTPLAAYFSHQEPANPGKRSAWDRAAQKVDLRICTAPQYVALLEHSGHSPTVIVRPPIDPQFVPPTRVSQPSAEPVIGLSGWVYRDGRKGEALLAQLLGHDISATLRYAATGEGWPSPITGKVIRWELMPAFYASLDVYLCTSLIEGVPMPPLEALATCCPVVIPRGVGLLDSIPETPGAVYHYAAGDLGSLVETLRRAVDQFPATPDVFASITSLYTPAAWAFDHTLAFDTHIRTRSQRQVAGRLSRREALSPSVAPLPVQKPPIPEGLERLPVESVKLTAAELATAAGSPKPPALVNLPVPTRVEHADWHGHAGVYVVAYGDQARECAVRLLRSWDQYMPGVPVCVAAETPLPITLTDTALEYVLEPRADRGGRSAKTRIYDLAPSAWEYVLYLDADTELIADISYLYEVLSHGWEFFICKNPQRFHIARFMKRPDNEDECRATFAVWGSDEMMQWNGGVFGFRRCPNTEAFLRSWHEEWQVYAQRDQGALLRAMWKHPLRTVWLGGSWNRVLRYETREGSAGIIHHVEEARDFKGLLPGRLNSAAALAYPTLGKEL